MTDHKSGNLEHTVQPSSSSVWVFPGDSIWAFSRQLSSFEDLLGSLACETSRIFCCLYTPGRWLEILLSFRDFLKLSWVIYFLSYDLSCRMECFTFLRTSYCFVSLPCKHSDVKYFFYIVCLQEFLSEMEGFNLVGSYYTTIFPIDCEQHFLLFYYNSIVKRP